MTAAGARGLRAVILGSLLALSGRTAAGEGSKVWDGLYDARLVQALDGTSDVAAQLLEETLDGLPVEDPQRGEVLFWLARANWENGDPNTAVELLQEAARDPVAATRARTMLARIELLRHEVTRLPMVCGFDHDTCGIQRAWADAEKGGIERQDAGDEPALAWDTTVTTAGSDHLLLAISAEVNVARVGLRIRTSTLPADLRLHVLDGSGGRWSSPMYRVSPDEWLTIELPISRFTAVTQGLLGRPPQRVRLLEIEDLTGLLSTDRGPNTLFLDDLRLE